ncbi:hypothetical protein RND71_035218 [Anisodus tanguticus]|uniref:Uncharacterized protein n=1 Tax=Anisodus tanguticus TaxID=243964 RepID=A0AAE1R6R0_9SOLA|nr:hypothetical protein RND71_035218 [Anisodus tanguticus]
MASVIEQCQVAPPPSCADKLTLPLTYFDILWLNFHPIRRTLFYKLPISKSNFIQNIIPTLKDSLSVAVKHYLPLAGNVACPLSSNDYRESRYVTGDSVFVTFSESNMDFDYLISNHICNAKDFYPFVPRLVEPKDAPEVQLAPVLAIQVTLFPNHGVSICFTNHHVVGDGASIVAFIRAWASLNKVGRDDQQFLANEFVPFYDRSVVKFPHGLGELIWGEKKKDKLEMRDIIVTPPDNDAIGGETDENVMEFFGCAVDCRRRFDPPLPSSYFGNCIVGYMASIRHADLVGNEGFTIAVELIGETIHERNKDKEYMLTSEWLKEVPKRINT